MARTILLVINLLFSLGAGQLANFDDLVRLASINPNSESRSDRSLTNTYPFNLGERQTHHGHNPSARRNYDAVLQSHESDARHGTLSSSISGGPASSFHLGHQSGVNSQLAGISVQQQVAAARRDSLPLHSSVQHQVGGQQQSLLQRQQLLAYQHQQQSQLLRQSGYQQHQLQTVQQPVQQQTVYQQQQAFIGPAPAPTGYAPAPAATAYAPAPAATAYAPAPAATAYAPAPAAAPAPALSYSNNYELSEHDVAPVITVTNDAVIAVDAAPAPPPVAVPASCPAPARLPHQCGGAVNTCWSIGVADVDCPGHSICCFDGCSNYCLGQARAVARPALVIPDNRLNPAQKRQRNPATFPAVAAAGKKCIDKIEQVEEIEYDDVEECHHSYDKKCHTSYTTEYDSQQEEECDDNYKKECDITYSPHATNVTVNVCMTPLIKDCNLSGPEVCRTEYVSECWTKNDPHTVVDDVPKCRTEYEEKCENIQSGYVTEEKCSKWPREVCTIAKEFRSKANPVTKCEKIPQRLCGPAGCGFVPGPEQCHEEVKTIVTDIPNEVCDLVPQRKCSHVTKLVPKLTPVEECVDVPKEVCQRSKGNPRKVLKPVTKKWCYVPSEESGLI